jgi:hypothetical protein
MTLKELYLLFTSGNLTSCSIVSAPLCPQFYELHFERKNKDVIILKTQRGGSRRFRSIDTAMNVSKSIGFRIATIRII